MRALQQVTRLEIADALGGAFGSRPVTRDRLIDVAQRNGAREELLATLKHLPDRGLRDLRDLWRHIPAVPVGEMKD